VCVQECRASYLCRHSSETESRPPGLEGLIATGSDHHGGGEFDGARAGGIGGPRHWLALSNVTPYHLPSPHHITSHNIINERMKIVRTQIEPRIHRDANEGLLLTWYPLLLMGTVSVPRELLRTLHSRQNTIHNIITLFDFHIIAMWGLVCILTRSATHRAHQWMSRHLQLT
jgi:hypothetical protein